MCQNLQQQLNYASHLHVNATFQIMQAVLDLNVSQKYANNFSELIHKLAAEFYLFKSEEKSKTYAFFCNNKHEKIKSPNLNSHLVQLHHTFNSGTKVLILHMGN